MQHKILLLDELGDRWGKTHVYHNLRTPADAIKLLCINYPDFAKYLATSHEQGITYQITQVDQELNYDDLHLPLGKHDLVITPVITGSRDAVKAVAGVALVVATGGIGTALGVAGAGPAGLFGATGGLAGVVGGVVGKIGVGLILNGVSDMISPQPQLPSFEFDFNAPLSGYTGGAGGITRGSDGSQSYGYTGPSNTVGLGKTVPVVYGKALVGGHTLSTDIEIANESDPLMKLFRPAGLDTVRLNGEELKFVYTTAVGLEAKRGGRVETPSGTARYIHASFGDTDVGGLPTVRGPVTVDLQKEGLQFLANIEGSNDGNTNHEDFQIHFRVGGLVDFVGNEGTTRIDGFITYAIEIEERSTNNLVLNNQATIQGLTFKSQKYNYFAKLPFQFIEGKDNYVVRIKIIDTSVDFDQAVFIVQGMGYNLKKK